MPRIIAAVVMRIGRSEIGPYAGGSCTHHRSHFVADARTLRIIDRTSQPMLEHPRIRVVAVLGAVIAIASRDRPFLGLARSLMAPWPSLMRNRFDHVAKQIGEKALGPSGTTVTQDPINPETQYADLRHEPDPARQAERERLGLLGQLAAVACIIEVYSEAPSSEEFRACLAKHLAAWQRRVREARSRSKKRGEPPPPDQAMASHLWIIAAGVPTTLLGKLKLERSARWPAGIYLFGDDVLRVGIVVASELPRNRASLLVRLMAAGPLLAPAVKDLAALPPDAYERAVAEPILLQLQHTLGQDSSRDPDEQEFIMAMLKSWEEGKAEARAEARAEAHANDVLTVLRVRGIAVPDAARERILTEKDLEHLKRWHEKAIIASSIAEVIDDAR
jgi:hypothetical protein